MKAGTGFVQSYKAQAAVEVASRLIVGARVSQAPNDKPELVPAFAAIVPEVGPVAAVLADNGFYSAASVPEVEPTAAGAAPARRFTPPWIRPRNIAASPIWKRDRNPPHWRQHRLGAGQKLALAE
jgi:hypothetical protein